MAEPQPPGAIPAITIIPAPSPVSAASARTEWGALAAQPELAATAAWTAACRGWWLDEHDARLRDQALGALYLGPDELAGWFEHRLDQAALIRAHGHVTSMRAGVERDVSRRHLATGTLRSGTVLAEHRRGARTVFTAPENVPAQVERLAATFAQLPAHPLLRAAWLVQAIGAIHPFRDANGGTSRLMASLELARGWLPPLKLSVAQRNGPYIDALLHANRTGELGPLTSIVHDVVQQGVAVALLSGGGGHAGWDDRARARALGWSDAADRSWRATIGEPLAATLRRDQPSAAAAIARLASQGYRLPAEPTPICTRWTLSAPLPIQLDLAIVPVRGGMTTWLLAMIAASIGDDGELGPAGLHEPVATMLIAPSNEPDDVADPRFGRWLDHRLDQCVRGLSHWM